MMEITNTGRVLQDFLSHRSLAEAWVRYSSPTGRATEKRVLDVMRRTSKESLARMLAARHVEVR